MAPDLTPKSGRKFKSPRIAGPDWLMRLFKCSEWKWSQVGDAFKDPQYAPLAFDFAFRASPLILSPLQDLLFLFRYRVQLNPDRWSQYVRKPDIRQSGLHPTRHASPRHSPSNLKMPLALRGLLLPDLCSASSVACDVSPPVTGSLLPRADHPKPQSTSS